MPGASFSSPPRAPLHFGLSHLSCAPHPQTLKPQETENYLTDHNEPKEDCIICYERPAHSELFRTECFHFFHRDCMARYVSHRRENPNIVR